MMKYFLILLLLLLLPMIAVAEWNPAGFKKWRDSEVDTLFRQRIGGEIANYQEDDLSWAVIENDFLLSGDTLIYNQKDLIKTAVKPNGISVVKVTWNDVDYIVTQKMIKLIWLNTQTWNWTDVIDNVGWPTPSVDSNIVHWSNIFPQVDYRIRKRNSSVAYGIFFKPLFLDSAVTLYNQRSDSLDIALGNVIEYSLMNVDNPDSVMDVRWRKLRQLGRYVFQLTKQRVHFPGSDTLPELPVRQRWLKRNGKLYCVEYVMMGKIKQIHEAYPGATIWHNSTAKIEGTTDIEDSHIDEGANADNNYGGANTIVIQESGSDFNGLIRVKNVAANLGASATIQFCSLSIYSYDQTGEPNIATIRVFKPWVEGTQDGGSAEPGATWNDWDNDAYEWATAGCNNGDDGGSDNSGDGTGADRKISTEDIKAITTDGVWVHWEITPALAQGWYDETINEEGVMIRATGSNEIAYFNSTETGSLQPYWTFIYNLNLPVLENYTSNNNGTDEADSVMLGKPTGVEVGNLLLLIAGNDYTGAASAFDEITGWTRFVNVGDGSTDCKLACYWRIADGLEGDSIEVTTGAQADEIWGWYIRVSNVDQAAPINDVGTALLNASASTHDITQATSDVDNCLVIYALSFDGGDGYTFSESNTGWTEEDEQQAGTGGNDASGCWGVKTLYLQGGAGTVTITSTAGDGAAAIQFAIAPAPAVAAAGQVIMIQQ